MADFKAKVALYLAWMNGEKPLSDYPLNVGDAAGKAAASSVAQGNATVPAPAGNATAKAPVKAQKERGGDKGGDTRENAGGSSGPAEH